MDGVCRLCCSGSGVTHNIFDECKSTYMKLSTCLPVKVVRDDQLPQKICNRCFALLEGFYKFCSEAIAAQERLLESISVYCPDKLSDVKSSIEDLKNVASKPPQFRYMPVLKPISELKPSLLVLYDTKYTQTDELDLKPDIKTEVNEQHKNEPEKIKIIIKKEPERCDENIDDFDYVPSNPDFSDDDVALNLLKKKKKKHKKEKREDGEVKRRKRKRKEIKNEMDLFIPEVKEEVPVTNGIKQEWMGLEELLDPSMIKSEIVEDIHYCCICFVQCSGKHEMMAHYRSHVNPELFHLEPTQHIAEAPAEGDKPARFCCKICSREYPDREMLEHHISDHETKRPYRCSLCEKTFRQVEQILKHGRTHSYEAPPTTAVAECVVPDCPTALKGELCPDSHLEVKPRTHPQPLSKRFVCDMCTESFVYMRYLMEHRNSAHPEASTRKLVNRCMHCQREFAHLNSLRRHLRSHTGERNFLCNVCGKALSSREHLKFHIRIHTGYKPNVCKTCGKGFVKKCNLTLHERVHSGEKPHVCSHCGKAFSQRSTLVIHERYHSGARPYVCTLCGKGFVAKGLLSMHLKTTCI